MNTNWLSTVRYILRSLGALLFLFAIAAHSFPWLLGLLSLSGLNLLVLSVMIYRPPEDHLAAVYFVGRFKRWITPDGWVLLTPWLEHIKREINLRPEVIHVVLPRIPTRDRVALTAEFNVRFQFDPRHVSRTLRTTVLDLPPIALHKAVEDQLQVAANDILGTFKMEQALHPGAFTGLSQRLSRRLAELLFPIGGVIHEETGVVLLKLYPDEQVQQAWQRKLAAHLEGQADLARVAPILAHLAQHPAGAAMNVLLTEYAATLAATGQPPATILNTQPTVDSLALNALLRTLNQDEPEPPLTLKPGPLGPIKNAA